MQILNRRDIRIGALVVLILMVSCALTFVACNKEESPTGPSGISSSSSSQTNQSSTSPTEPQTEAPVPAANPGVQLRVNADNTVRITNPTPDPFTARICAFINGPHPQTFVGPAGGQNVAVGVGEDKTVAVELAEQELCGDVRLQVDAGQAGKIDCSNPSDSLGQVIAYGYPVVEFEPCCKEEWVAGEPVRENVGDWTECSAERREIRAFTNDEPPPPEWTECDGWMYRDYEEVVYETNTCTRAVREKSRVRRTEESPCGYQCLAGITHTENSKWCGWGFYKDHGDWTFGYHCENQWFFGSELKWQCASVPPGTPGHYPNHFNANGHDDYFGEPNEDRCYNTVN